VEGNSFLCGVLSWIIATEIYEHINRFTELGSDRDFKFSLSSDDWP
jgi:hypothetical protein